MLIGELVQGSYEARLNSIVIMGCILEQISNQNIKQHPKNQPARWRVFQSETVPPVSISAYLDRLAKYSNSSQGSLILALYYMGSLVRHVPNFIISPFNVHRLLLVSVLCASKFHDDVYFSNSFFAKIGGVSVKELNRLEVEFLALIRFNLYVAPELYYKFFEEIQKPQVHSHCMCLRSKQAHITTVNPQSRSAWSGNVRQRDMEDKKPTCSTGIAVTNATPVRGSKLHTPVRGSFSSSA
jgi:hypothetical protein